MGKKRDKSLSAKADDCLATHFVIQPVRFNYVLQHCLPFWRKILTSMQCHLVFRRPHNSLLFFWVFLVKIHWSKLYYNLYHTQYTAHDHLSMSPHVHSWSSDITPCVCDVMKRKMLLPYQCVCRLNKQRNNGGARYWGHQGWAVQGCTLFKKVGILPAGWWSQCIPQRQLLIGSQQSTARHWKKTKIRCVWGCLEWKHVPLRFESQTERERHLSECCVLPT